VKQKLQANGSAQYFGKIARHDREFAKKPKNKRNRARILVAAGLRQIAAADNAQARTEGLQEQRHQVGNNEHPEQAIAKFCAAFEISCPVAGVHIADADQIRRAGEGERRFQKCACSVPTLS